jgi:hypothetical protein
MRALSRLSWYKYEPPGIPPHSLLPVRANTLEQAHARESGFIEARNVARV